MTVATATDTVLKKIGLNLSNYNRKELLSNFLAAMESGLIAADKDLKMLPTYIEPKPAPLHKEVIILDAGGTNLRVAKAHFGDDSKLVMESFKKQPIPGLQGQVSADEFIDVIADLAAPLMKEPLPIGFCFSYPAETTPNLDGRVLCLTKGIDAPEMVGHLVGDDLKKAIKAKTSITPEKVVVLNDTTAALLAGEMAHTSKTYSAYVGFILGTGMNCAYTEFNSSIKKLTGLKNSATQVVNTEAGNFKEFTQLDIDKKLHDEIGIGNAQLLEKAVSGAYLGRLAHLAFLEAAQYDAFSTQGRYIIENWSGFATPQLDTILFNQRDLFTKDLDSNDFFTVKSIVDELLNRAALLASVCAAGAIIRSAQTKNRTSPVCVNLEGTTLLKMPGYISRFDTYLKMLISDVSGPSYETVSVDNAPMIGAAIAGLTQ